MRNLKISPTRGLVAALCATAVALAACGSGSSSDAGGVVDVRLLFGPSTLDPQAGSGIADQALAAYAYDSPVALRDGKIVPQLASRWRVTPTSAKLWIKRGVTCSDGSKLTAAEVADSINRMRDPRTQAVVAPIAFGTPSGFSASADMDANTVTVRLREPFGDLLFGLTQVYVVCRAGLEDPEKLKTTTLGSGPYKLTDSVSGAHYAYEARKDYAWGPNGARNDGGDVPSGIDFKVVESETTATNQFLTGTLDLTLAQGRDSARLDRSAEVTHKAAVPVDTYYLTLNHAAGRPTANVDVRRLLTASVDRAELAQTAIGEGAEVPKTLVLPSGLCYRPDEIGSAMIGHSASAAQRYARAAGYTRTGDKLTRGGRQLSITVVVPNVVPSATADLLISSWGTAGIDVRTQSMPAAQAIEKLSTPGGDWDVALVGLQVLSPAQLFAMFAGPSPPNGPNYSRIENGTFLKLAAGARARLTESACDEWAAAERALYADADIIPFARAEPTWYGRDLRFKPWLLTAVYPDSLRWAK